MEGRGEKNVSCCVEGEENVRGVERKESKTKAGAEKQELVGVSGLTLHFLSSSELLVIGSRA